MRLPRLTIRHSEVAHTGNCRTDTERIDKTGEVIKVTPRSRRNHSFSLIRSGFITVLAVYS